MDGDHSSTTWRSCASRGFDVHVTATRANQMFNYPAWAARKVAGAISARHVVVEINRPR